MTNILALTVLYPYVFKGMCTHIKVESSKLFFPISSISEGDKPLVQILIQMDCNTFLAVVLMFYLSIPTFLLEMGLSGNSSILGHGVCAVHWAVQLMNSDLLILTHWIWARGIYGIMTAHFWRCFDQDLSSPSWVEQCLQRLTRGPLLNMDTREDWGPLEFFGL